MTTTQFTRATLKGHGKPERLLYAGTHRDTAGEPRLVTAAIEGGNTVKLRDAETGEDVLTLGTSGKFWAAPAPVEPTKSQRKTQRKSAAQSGGKSTRKGRQSVKTAARSRAKLALVPTKNEAEVTKTKVSKAKATKAKTTATSEPAATPERKRVVRSPALSTDTTDIPTDVAGLNHLIKITRTRRYKAAQRGDKTVASAMEEKLTKLVKLREAAKNREAKSK